jgi:hypothetical protein
VLEADPKHANNLSNYADFLDTVRGDNVTAEKLRQQQTA